MNILKKYIANHNRLKSFLLNSKGKGIVENIYHSEYKKNCLLMYSITPFVLKEKRYSHQIYWQVLEIAKAISNYQFNIDVIDYWNTSVTLKKDYDMVLDLTPGRNKIIQKHLKENAIKIAYLTGSNPRFANNAEKKRLEYLKQRRGYKLKQRRQSPVLTKAIEQYHAAMFIGNRHNLKTYQEYKMPPVYFIKNNGYDFEFKFDRSKKDSRSFLFLSSAGQVHKGLDLLLDIFSERNYPYELYICSSFGEERDFVHAYRNELFQCPNIHPIGFIDILGRVFQKIVSKCVYAIMPSCSEGQSGSVCTAMSAGLINICSKECGFEDDEVIHLQDCRIETIRMAIQKYSDKDMDWIEGKSKKSYEIAQSRYGQKNFLNSIHAAFDKILQEDVKI